MTNCIGLTAIVSLMCLTLTACGGDNSGAAGGTGGSGGGGAITPPPATCSAPKQPADVSSPTATVGDGTAGSCTEAALRAAIAGGGKIVFSCGSAPVTIKVGSELQIAKDTILDGGGSVTLSGGGTTRIAHVTSAWDQVSPHVTLQHLAFVDGFTTDAMNTKNTNQGGAAVFREGGSLDVFDCSFSGNTCAKTGQDVSGGAITSQGVGDTLIVDSTFSNNTGSNGGAVGNLGNGLTVVNSSFDSNHATGTDGNPGNGGNGGAIVFDGANTTMSICGSVFTNNTAGAQGGAMFRVAYTDEATNIDRCSFDHNSADAKVGLAGALYLEYTTINLSASTLSNNSAHYGGSLWAGHAAILNLTNVTIANNTADQGGGVWFAGQVSGTIASTTLAGNTNTPGGYATGIFTGANAVKLVNSLVVNNGCKDVGLTSGGTNIQYPDSGGTCAPGALSNDPALGPLQDNGGPTKTMAPGAGSPAIGKGTSCPANDQRGQPRHEPCTLGAVEG